MEDSIVIRQSEILQAVNKADIDAQIATAKSFPRDLNASLNRIATLAMMDKETAEDCFYVLRRKDKNGQDNIIEGLSVRMAEIIATSWGNLRVQTRIIGNDGRMITAEAVCHDLETNYAVSRTVQRRITNSSGKTFSDDMQVVTGNAAASIAYRNAVLAVIPKAIIKRIVSEVKQVAMGQAIDVEQSRQNIIAYFAKLGVSQEQLLAHLEIASVEQIDKQAIFELRALRNAIEEGTTTVQETFVQPQLEAAKRAEANRKASGAMEMVQEALAQQSDNRSSTSRGR